VGWTAQGAEEGARRRGFPIAKGSRPSKCSSRQYGLRAPGTEGQAHALSARGGSHLTHAETQTAETDRLGLGLASLGDAGPQFLRTTPLNLISYSKITSVPELSSQILPNLAFFLASSSLLARPTPPAPS
jgi:hypothetical protein